MSTGKRVLWSSITSIALAVWVAGCGGGGHEQSPNPSPLSAGRSQILALAVSAPPSVCQPSYPTVTNIDFGQVAWPGDDSPGTPVAINTLVPVSLTFTDTGLADVHTAQWVWGDGEPNGLGVVTEAFGAGSAASYHSFATSGVYTVSATISDACASSTVTRQVVVYDPSSGFVTGGGWITSPMGAYVARPTLTGRANFGFVSKYLKGATVPSGNTEFQFQTANLNFHSESYEWLVVSGARAQYKGVGSINGVNGFKFLLTAVDADLLGGGNQADRLRIKIWHVDATTGIDVVDYDNNLDASLAGGTSEGTALGGGSIVIHK